MGMASRPRTTCSELSPFLLGFADLRSPLSSCSRSIILDVFCWLFLVTFLLLFFLDLGVTDFLFALVFGFFFAAVALALGDVDLLPAVLLDLCVAAAVALAVVIALRVEVFVLLRSVFLWSELPSCGAASSFVLPSESVPASRVFLGSGSSDRKALFRALPLDELVEFFLRVWWGFGL